LAEATPERLNALATLFADIAANRATAQDVQEKIGEALETIAAQVETRLDTITPIPLAPNAEPGDRVADATIANLSNLRHVVASLLVEASQGEIAKTDSQRPNTPLKEVVPEGVTAPAFDFLKFEGLTRGTETAIREEQEKYLSFFNSLPNVLDAGCGRGEFLELLRHAGVDAYGIDSDPQMVLHCQGKGLRVEQSTVLEHLASISDRSIGGIFLGQVVEHLTPEVLATLAELSFRRLRPGGYFVAETINPTCLTTFSGAFYADPTHVKPLHPKAMEYFLVASGFVDIEFVYSAPIPAAEKLAPMTQEFNDPEVAKLAALVGANFDRLNSVLYNHANYAIAGRRPLDT
jgi:SAM-dependent methyltransferase